jgi:hypothetical protein
VYDLERLMLLTLESRSFYSKIVTVTGTSQSHMTDVSQNNGYARKSDSGCRSKKISQVKECARDGRLNDVAHSRQQPSGYGISPFFL